MCAEQLVVEHWLLLSEQKVAPHHLQPYSLRTPACARNLNVFTPLVFSLFHIEGSWYVFLLEVFAKVFQYYQILWRTV